MIFESSGSCWFCGLELTYLDYGRADTCRKCGRDTKVCKGCVFYDPSMNNECQESQSDRVVEKERSNFCDYFKPGKSVAVSSSSRDAMKLAAESLFKKKE